jgi:toxin ParE1/3/4
MRIRWTAGAADDLERISDYIAGDSPEAALRVARAIFSRINELGKFPHLGRKGQEEGTREFVLTPLPYSLMRTTHSLCAILPFIA